jgi:hypothetical protein
MTKTTRANRTLKQQPLHVSFTLGVILSSAFGAMIPSHCFGLAISPGSDSTAGLGNTANAIVRIADPGGSGTGTIIQMMAYNGGVDLDVLTADHVIRDDSGGGSTIYTPGQINVAFGNAGGGGASFAAEDEATLFDLPSDGSSAVDLAILDVFIPGSQLNTLPAGLAAAALPNAGPAANTAITQAGYGHQASVVNLGGTLSYVYSPLYGYGAGYGTLKAGPNSINGAGVTAITGAVSDYAGQRYAYQGFQNNCVINGASPNYNGSTSFIFAGDSGGPSLSGNTILGVHSSSTTGTLTGNLGNDKNSEIADSTDMWQDVSVADYLPWIKTELTTLSVPEPSISSFAMLGGLIVLATRRYCRKACSPRKRINAAAVNE